MAAQPSRFVVLDVETTGLEATDRLIEIGLVEYDIDSGRVVDEYETLINPERNLAGGATDAVHIHEITNSMLKDAPTFEDVADDLKRRLDGAVLVAHNLPFDSRFLQQEFDRAGIDFRQGEGFCTKQATGLSLAKATKHYGVELDGHHRALVDARATAELLGHVHREDPVDRSEVAGCEVGSVGRPTDGQTEQSRVFTRGQALGTSRSRRKHRKEMNKHRRRAQQEEASRKRAVGRSAGGQASVRCGHLLAKYPGQRCGHYVTPAAAKCASGHPNRHRGGGRR